MPIQPDMRTYEQQLEFLTDWLRNNDMNLVSKFDEVIPIGTELFRLTRSSSEEEARQILKLGPAFFATTQDGANKYLPVKSQIKNGRLVMIRGTVKEPLHVASACQSLITETIFLGLKTNDGRRIGPFNALHPNSSALEDMPVISIQRWIVLVAVEQAINRKLDGLRDAGTVEMIVREPLNLDLRFEWQ